MIRRLVLSVALCLSASAANADGWTGPDKVLHLQAGALIAAPVSAATGSWRTGAAVGCAVGIAKEFNDMRSPGHTPSYRDAVVTCLGAAIGSQLGVSVAPIAGGVWVGRSWSF